jgi:signal transduction histidine kinase/CheY-like chemotaxis protein
MQHPAALVKLVVVSLWLALFAHPALGQQPTASSSFDALVAISNENMVIDPDLALESGTAAERRASDRIQRATALWLQSEALLRLKRADEGMTRIVKASQLLERVGGQVELRANILLTRGGIDVETGRIADALRHYQQAYRLFQSSENARKQAITLIVIAELFRQGSDFESALRYYQRAYEAYQGDPVFTVSLINNRANLLNDMQRFNEAVAEYRVALRQAQQVENNYWRAHILANLARSQAFAGDLDGARASISQGRQQAARPGGERALDDLRVVEALVALQADNVAVARTHIERRFAGVDLATTTLGARPAHRIAYTVYARSGNSARALGHLEALRRLDDQTNRIATSTSAALMSARFDFANQELRIANLKAEELRRNVAFERSRTRLQQTVFAVAALGTLLVFALLAYNLYTTRRSRNEIRAANAELEQTNVRLEKALAAKTEFLATTSHEIRTPLNGILGMTQVMLADGSVSGRLKDRIDIVHGAGLTMKALVDDILDVAKMETGHLSVSLEPTDLHATLGEVTRMWEEQAHAKGLAFLLDSSGAPRWIETDPGRLRQIAFNLLANALKFTESGGITMRVKQRGEGDDARLTIAVRDTGIGIAPEKQGDIFESFKQVDSGTTRKYGGTGLGLAICRNLAQALGGDIGVESVEGEGATFTLDIPLRLTTAPDGIEPDIEGGVLLILDRNPINRSMLRTLLEPRTGHVRFAGDVDEAVRALMGGGVSHVLIDDGTVRGGQADPIALIGKVTAAAANAGARSAVLWKAPSDEDRSRLRETALDIVIAKPVAGAAMADALFGANGKPPLVSQAA